jgi:hypothetical protein
MKSKRLWFVVFVTAFCVLAFSLSGGAPVLAEGEDTYVVQRGDTLWRLAQRFDTTVDDLVYLNDIRNPDLIFVGQVLVLPGSQASAPKQAVGGPLSLSWTLDEWRPADPDYVATLALRAEGGTPPYRYYHDGIALTGPMVAVAWRRCRPKPGGVSVTDAAGQSAKLDYWLEAPYCPVGVEIVEPEPDHEYTNSPRHFNLTWRHTVDPPPPVYGIEIEVWGPSGWQPWQSYVHERGDRELFFVPDAFPGDVGGRVRMWGIYGKQEAYEKTPWRYFEFRVTY